MKQISDIVLMVNKIISNSVFIIVITTYE